MSNSKLHIGQNVIIQLKNGQRRWKGILTNLSNNHFNINIFETTIDSDNNWYPFHEHAHFLPRLEWEITPLTKKKTKFQEFLATHNL